MNPSDEELLFTAAAAFDDPKERGAFLDVACRHDSELRKRMDEMFEIEEEAATFFELQPEVQPDGETAEPSADEEGIGGHIGRYRLITRIGAGGCGVVYYAEQEKPVRRKVALKIVKLGMDTEAVISRFEQERQALAQMDHPNIARVLDAAATASGRPYFVMELVGGEKITDFCDANHFNIRQRLELFVQVCRAIQHAHQKGLIHRDIKPSNVLVHWQEAVPMPKVIDFGIAKATAGINGNHATVTASGQFVGTPAYMSPEQAQGSADIDTRTDIYSLGVLLYELLSGRPPFDLKRITESSTDEIRRIIREEEPRRPSVALKAAAPEQCATIAENRATDARNVIEQLSIDLDWIVMKAMEKERSRRYDTATGLAADVLRYLKNEVVQARPPSRAYRFGKLVRRNKLVFTAGSIAVFALIVGFGTSTFMYFREKAARQEQARLRQRAELRSYISQAAVKLKYNDIAGADELLAKVPIAETPSSLEAASSFAAVADWHAHAARLKEAAARYSSMIRALASVDNSDIPDVSFNLLPAAGGVAYSGGAQAYEELRQFAIKRFGATTNPQVAEQTLKACLLLPADKATLQALTPLARIVERAYDANNGVIDGNPSFTVWACFAVSLMNYRAGEYDEAVLWNNRALEVREWNPARVETAAILRAMIEQKQGRPMYARAFLAQGRAPIRNAIATSSWRDAGTYWFDWINAAILLHEAEQLIANR